MYSTGSISHRSLGKKVSFEGPFQGGRTGNFPYGKREGVVVIHLKLRSRMGEGTNCLLIY